MLANSKAMAKAFMDKGYKVISGGTDNHSMLIDLRTKFPDLTGKKAENTLVLADITINKNMVPFDTRTPFSTSGLRVGTPAITTRGLKEEHMPVIVDMIDRVYVAGGIGSGINMKNAVNIGMFPDVDIEKFHYIGNSSLTGAYAMVMSNEAEAKCAEVAANMTYLELSTYPGYMDSFVAACFLPHTDRSLFPHSIQER